MLMKKQILTILAISLIAVSALMPALVYSKQDETKLTIIELRDFAKPVKPDPPPTVDDSESNGNYALLAFHWTTTANYWVNTANTYMDFQPVK